MRDFITSQITALRLRLQDLDRQKLTVETELSVYEKMLDHMAPSGQESKPNGGSHPQKSVERNSASVPSEMTPTWRKILGGVDALGRTFGAGDILKVSESLGVPTKMANARSQIYQWDKKHIITRVRKGKYRLSQKGVDTVRKVDGLPTEPSEPSAVLHE